MNLIPWLLACTVISKYKAQTLSIRRSIGKTIIQKQLSLVYELTKNTSCAHFLTDSSHYSLFVYRLMVSKVPLKFSKSPLGMSDCPYLVVVVASLKSLPNIDFKVLPNPRFRIAILTNTSIQISEANEKLYFLRRARLVVISQKNGSEEYFTFIQQSSTNFVSVNKSNAKGIFERKVSGERLMDFSGAKITIIAVNASAKSLISEPDRHGRISWYNGYELLLLMNMCRVIGLTPEVKTLPPGVKYDFYFKNGSLRSPGIQTYIKNWTADASVGGIWLRPSMAGSYDFISPWDFQCLRYLVPRPRHVAYEWSLYWVVLEPHLWLLIAFCNIAVAFISTIVSRISPNAIVSKDDHTFLRCLFTSTFTLVQQYFPKHQHGALAPLSAAWVWTSYILGAAYVAQLNSMLIRPAFEQKVDTISEFLEKGYTYGHPPNNRNHPIGDDIFDSEARDEWREWIYNKYRVENSLEERIQRMATRKYALPGQSAGRIFHFTSLNIPPDSVLNDYEAADRCYQHFISTPIFPFGSPYSKALNIATSRFRSGGILKSWTQDILISDPLLKKFVAPNAFNFAKDAQVKSTPLSFGETLAAFCILVVGLISATVVFCIELVWKFSKNRNKRFRR